MRCHYCTKSIDGCWHAQWAVLHVYTVIIIFNEWFRDYVSSYFYFVVKMVNAMNKLYNEREKQHDKLIKFKCIFQNFNKDCDLV